MERASLAGAAQRRKVGQLRKLTYHRLDLGRRPSFGQDAVALEGARRQLRRPVGIVDVQFHYFARTGPEEAGGALETKNCSHPLVNTKKLFVATPQHST